MRRNWLSSWHQVASVNQLPMTSGHRWDIPSNDYAKPALFRSILLALAALWLTFGDKFILLLKVVHLG
jgi:hypothetical protein